MATTPQENMKNGIRIQEFREEVVTELDDSEDMIAENDGIGFY